MMDATVEVNGITLSYRHWPGERGPILCLPSLTGHKGIFDGIAGILAPEYDLYALDLRGRGDSDKPDEGYGFAYHARDIQAFAIALGFEHFSIIGHSFGATVGVYLASIRPMEITSLVMIDGGADPKEEVLEAMRPALRRLGTTYISMEEYLGAMRDLPYYRPWNETLENYLRADVETLPDGNLRSKSSPQAIERDLDVHFYYSMCVHFPTLQCPNMFVRPREGLLGDKAHVLDEREASAFVAWIPKCWRVDLPDVNHYTMILSDKPVVAAPIRAFLSTVYEDQNEEIPS
jgi:pimeloyl-ACP methyl ester carboxylesterase